MPYIAYPFHVKHDGVEYAPGEPIQVDSPDQFLSAGAAVAQAPDREITGRTKRRTPQKDVIRDGN